LNANNGGMKRRNEELRLCGNKVPHIAITCCGVLPFLAEYQRRLDSELR